MNDIILQNPSKLSYPYGFFHHMTEYWITIDCDCPKSSLVYKCLGKIEKNRLISEPQESWAKFLHESEGIQGSLSVPNFKPKTIQILTYGQPRVGNKGFAQYVNQEIPNLYRVINGKDTVANSPSRCSTGWVHHEKEYWIDPNSKKTYSCAGAFDGSGSFVDESQKCLNAPGQYNSALNAGPYFSITMGKTCLPPGGRT
ncbi:hypothetical protein G9A89_008464, partial [Geosiphon pyriformis]